MARSTARICSVVSAGTAPRLTVRIGPPSGVLPAGGFGLRAPRGGLGSPSAGERTAPAPGAGKDRGHHVRHPRRSAVTVAILASAAGAGLPEHLARVDA